MLEQLIVFYLVGSAITLGWSIKMIVEMFSKGVPGAIGFYEHIFAGGLTVVFLLLVPVFSWVSVGYILASMLVSIEEKLAFQIKGLLESKED